MAEFIYQMYKARKAHGDKVILDDVTLSDEAPYTSQIILDTIKEAVSKAAVR